MGKFDRNFDRGVFRVLRLHVGSNILERIPHLEPQMERTLVARLPSNHVGLLRRLATGIQTVSHQYEDPRAHHPTQN